MSTEKSNGACATPINTKFESFVILDFETNNLPNLNFNKISVTEICMYGCLKEHFLQSVKAAKQINNPNDSTVPQMPRATQKLILQVNPRAPIHSTSEEITGLSNYLLENCKSFNVNTANIILNFIKQFPQPVCLVAHNGHHFDFPILKWLLAKFVVQLPKDCVCVDSYRAFYEIDGYSEELTEAIKICDSIQEEERNLQLINETTPKRQKISVEVNTPIKSNGSNGTTYRKTAYSSRKNLFPEEERDEENKKNDAVERMLMQFYPNSKVGHYKLGNIYKRIFGTSPNVAHYAEADVYTLLVLMIYYGKEFLNYSEKWAAPFEKIEMKYKITN